MPNIPDKVARQIGERIKDARENARLTQRALAQAAGLHPVQLSKIEGGKAIPGFDTTIRIAAVLNVDLRQFVPTEGISALPATPPGRRPAREEQVSEAASLIEALAAEVQLLRDRVALLESQPRESQRAVG